jgi:hypothetical protein
MMPRRLAEMDSPCLARVRMKGVDTSNSVTPEKSKIPTLESVAVEWLRIAT